MTGQRDDKRGNDHENVIDRPRVDREIKTEKPKMYKVIMLNDDYTPFDFVVIVLQHVFAKSQEEAIAVMLKAHQTGKAIAGVYSFEVAESKQYEAMNFATQHQQPLRVELEPES